MATRVYKSGIVKTIDGLSIPVRPLKIKYLRDFMINFELLKVYQGIDEQKALAFLVESIVIAMRQYSPDMDTTEKVEDSFDVQTLYDILNFAADISVESKKESSAVTPSEKESKWEDFDLASLEAEVFLLGIWKDYETLEESMSLPELLKTLEIKRELDYSEKKFFAAIQGVDLDESTGKEKEPDPWEAMKARVFSGGRTTDPNDITAYQGVNAAKAGFGIGNGLSYEKIG
tara:strand:+ start:2137 stop:2829 length:693 start_codon:yes stop_codon:yes gene_type:complete